MDENIRDKQIELILLLTSEIQKSIKMLSATQDLLSQRIDVLENKTQNHKHDFIKKI